MKQRTESPAQSVVREGKRNPRARGASAHAGVKFQVFVVNDSLRESRAARRGYCGKPKACRGMPVVKAITTVGFSRHVLSGVLGKRDMGVWLFESLR